MMLNHVCADGGVNLRHDDKSHRPRVLRVKGLAKQSVDKILVFGRVFVVDAHMQGVFIVFCPPQLSRLCEIVR